MPSIKEKILWLESGKGTGEAEQSGEGGGIGINTAVATSAITGYQYQQS